MGERPHHDGTRSNCPSHWSRSSAPSASTPGKTVTAHCSPATPSPRAVDSVMSTRETGPRCYPQSPPSSSPSPPAPTPPPSRTPPAATRPSPTLFRRPASDIGAAELQRLAAHLRQRSRPPRNDRAAPHLLGPHSRRLCAAAVVRRQHGATVTRRGTAAARLSARARHHRRTPFAPSSSALRHRAPGRPARHTRPHAHRARGGLGRHHHSVA